MSDEHTFEQRIQRMQTAGTLSPEEAQRLSQTLRDQNDRGAQLRVDKPLRRMQPFILLLLLAFMSGAVTVWLLIPAEPAPSHVDAHTMEPATDRPIDLSNLDTERTVTMKRTLPLLIVIPLGVFALLGVWMVLLYNNLVTEREQVNAGWAQVENVYQRRLDLVPLLVDTVQTYTEHEQDTLNALTEARTGALQISSGLGGTVPQTAAQLRAVDASQGQVGAVLSRLFAVVENYPDLKASQNFLSLQDQLEGTENRVAIERRQYNEFSRSYNTRLQTFPGNLVALMMGFESKPYFEAETSALEAPDDPFGRRSS